MRVTLINPDQVAESIKLAGWMGSVSAGIENASSEKLIKIGEKCIKSGHLSVTRPCLLIYRIEGISRACSHQFVREEVGVFKVQESQRYVKMDNPDFVLPPSVENNRQAKELFSLHMDVAWMTYHKLCEMGIPAEDARFVIPNAATTKIHVALSIEALKRIASKRCCNRAQWEIRHVVEDMVAQAVEACPFLRSELVRKCDTAGYCTEEKCCGYKPTKEKFFATYERGKFIEEGNK